jgi:EAL domain-containing protein (putative c-di-GMP-specific phosphodiesterase class I)
VSHLDAHPESEAMIRTLIALAHNLGMRVIVEGVETVEQLALVKALGASEVQGFLMGRPTLTPADHMMQPASL